MYAARATDIPPKRNPKFLTFFLDASTRSIKCELLLPCGIIAYGGLIAFGQEEAPQHKVVHFRPHEAAPCFLRRADNRLSTNIERGINDDGATALPVKRFYEIMIQRI